MKTGLLPGVREVYRGAAWLALVGAAWLPVAAQKDAFTKQGQAQQVDEMQHEKAPSMIDPAGPTISLLPSEQVFVMAVALNLCGYNDGLGESDPVRQRVRDEIQGILVKDETARDYRDQLCLFIAQHNMTGTLHDVSQYISLALYLSPPPELETTAELPEMPPDATQVVEVLPILRKFAEEVDLHGIWLTTRHLYEDEVNKLHNPLTKMIVDMNLYLKMPASTYDGRHFIVVVEPMFSPKMVNARIYGVDYVVVVSPVDGKIPMVDVKHTYLHYLLEPLLYQRTNALGREQPIMKEVRDAPMEFLYRSDTVALTIECMIKAIEARTMDTGIPAFVMPPNADRSDYPRLERERQIWQQKVNVVRQAVVDHDMRQGFVLTQYFYDQMKLFEHDPASLKDTIGEMVYSMDIDQQVHRARAIEFDKQADGDVLRHNTPHKLEGLDLAEARLAAGDTQSAMAIAQSALAGGGENPAETARAEFVIARCEAMTGHANEAVADFNKVLSTSKDLRLLSWSHIYLGRMLDLSCKRDAAVGEYQAALAVRDGQIDTRVAAEHGVKAPFTVSGHSCEDDDKDTASEGGDSDPVAAPE